VRDYVTCEHLKWLLPLADVYTKIVRSAKLGQCQPCQIDEDWEAEVIRRQGALSISGGSYLEGSGSVVGRAEDLRVDQIMQQVTQSLTLFSVHLDSKVFYFLLALSSSSPQQ